MYYILKLLSVKLEAIVEIKIYYVISTLIQNLLKYIGCMKNLLRYADVSLYFVV